MQEIVRRAVVRDLLEAEAGSMAEGRDRPQRIDMGPELPSIRGERRVPVEGVADREIEGHGRDEGCVVPPLQRLVVDAFPGCADLRDHPVGSLRELETVVRCEVELDPALLGNDPIVGEQGPRTDNEPEFPSPTYAEFRSEVMVVFGGKAQAHGALLAVEDADEFADLTVVL